MSRVPHQALALVLVLCCLAGAGGGVPGGDGKPSTVTVQRDDLPLREALKELHRQSGIAVADLTGKGNAPLTLNLKGLRFWQALDTIAAAAGARVSLYSPKGIALVDAPGGKEAQSAVPVSYHGLFRTSVRHLTINRDLETGTHTCALQLDLAWEPHFTTFLVETGPATVVFAPDARGKGLRAELAGQGRVQLTPPVSAHEIGLATRAPARTAPAVETLKGILIVTGASKMLTFTFDRLREIGPKVKAEEQTLEGVQVRLTEASHETGPDRFILEVVIDNPPGGPRFESYQSWLGNNSIWLAKKGKGRQHLVASPRDEEVLKQTATQAILRYHFTQKANPGVRFGKLSDWTLHYRTPGRIVEMSVPYEFKNVPLP